MTIEDIFIKSVMRIENPELVMSWTEYQKMKLTLRKFIDFLNLGPIEMASETNHGLGEYTLSHIQCDACFAEWTGCINVGCEHVECPYCGEYSTYFLFESSSGEERN